MSQLSSAQVRRSAFLLSTMLWMSSCGSSSPNTIVSSPEITSVDPGVGAVDMGIGPDQTVSLISNPSFMVNSHVDAVDANPGDGICATSSQVCSLRAAFQEANTMTGPVQIYLSTGQYTLSIQGDTEDASVTGDLDLLADTHVELIGEGADLTTITAIEGFSDRLIDVISPSATLTVSGLTLSGGEAETRGGAIQSRGSLTVDSCLFSDNQAVVSFGGGVSVTGGSASIRNSTFTQNVAEYGGGLYVIGVAQAVVVNTTFSQNQASRGGGIYNQGNLDLLNSTVAFNSADLGGGIFSQQGSFSIGNTVIGLNQTPNHATDVQGDIYSLGYNLISDTDRTNITGNTTGNLLDWLSWKHGGRAIMKKSFQYLLT